MNALTKWDPFKDWDPVRELDEFQNRLTSFFGQTPAQLLKEISASFQGQVEIPDDLSVF